MSEHEGLLALARTITQDTELKVAELTYTETAFASEYLQRLEELGVIDGFTLANVRGGSLRGAYEARAYYCDSDAQRVDFFLGLVAPPTGEFLGKVFKADLQTALNKLARVKKRAERGDFKELEPSSEAFGMLRSAHELMRKGASVRLLLFTHGEAPNDSLELNEEESEGVTIEVWDIRRLYRASQAGQETEVIDIDVERLLGAPIPCLPMPAQPENYQVYLAIIPGQSLFRLYERFGGRLMELNVRSFLQARGKVNAGIRKTLMEEPANFMAFNNGISATVNALEVRQGPDGTHAIYHMRGLQIVNGGQTTASIHNVVKKGDAEVTKVFVPAKITVLQEAQYEEYVPLISKYANTQNAVQIADLSANSEFHISLERLANQIWCPGQKGRWFYERARGGYQVALARLLTPAQQKKFKEEVPLERKLVKTDIARCLVAWEMKPYQVCDGAQKNFLKFMNDRASKGQYSKPDNAFFKATIAKHILFNEVLKVIKSVKLEAYGAQVAAYLVSFLSLEISRRNLFLDFKLIWEEQQLSAAFKTVIRSWIDPMRKFLVNSAGNRNVTEWCKRDECWKQLCGIKHSGVLPEDNKLPPEIRQRSEGEDVIREALEGDLNELEARVKSFAYEDWEDIARWGVDNGTLTSRQLQQAHTLARRAANDWKPKLNSQLIHEGAKMIRMKEEG